MVKYYYLKNSVGDVVDAEELESTENYFNQSIAGFEEIDELTFSKFKACQSLEEKALLRYGKGFQSEASGEVKIYDTDENSAKDIYNYANNTHLDIYPTTKIYSDLVPIGQAPVKARSERGNKFINNQLQALDATQIEKLAIDFSNFQSSIKSRLWSLENQVNQATSVDNVKTILSSATFDDIN